MGWAKLLMILSLLYFLAWPIVTTGQWTMYCMCLEHGLGLWGGTRFLDPHEWIEKDPVHSREREREGNERGGEGKTQLLSINQSMTCASKQAGGCHWATKQDWGQFSHFNYVQFFLNSGREHYFDPDPATEHAQSPESLLIGGEIQHIAVAIGLRRAEIQCLTCRQMLERG